MSVRGATVRTHQPLSKEAGNGKTVIRKAIDTHSEAKAKLRNSNTADGVGDAHQFVPEPQSETVPCDRLRKELVVTVLHRSRSKALCSAKEALLSLVRTTYSRIQSRGDTATAECCESSVQKGRSASQTRQTVNTGGHSTRQQPSRAMTHDHGKHQQSRKPVYRRITSKRTASATPERYWKSVVVQNPRERATDLTTFDHAFVCEVI